MVSTLLLRLAGPMQAWGTDSKFEIRRTGSEPSKSGVVGLLAAALGRRRDESLDDLNQLTFGVRVDQAGKMIRDLHIAKAEGKKDPYLTNRYYLSDAVFLVGLESNDKEFLSKLESFLKFPVFPLYLGRRSCPPSLPIVLGIRDASLLDSLKKEPWQAVEWRQNRYKESSLKLRLVTDVPHGEESLSVRQDLPFSFNPANRLYVWRGLTESEVDISLKSDRTDHDPMSELEEI